MMGSNFIVISLRLELKCETGSFAKQGVYVKREVDFKEWRNFIHLREHLKRM